VANEISYTIIGKLQNGGFTDDLGTVTYAFDQSAEGAWRNIVTVTTSEGDITPTGITTAGYCFIKNLDTTNYVQVGPKSGGSMVAFTKIKPGRFVILPLDPGATIRAKANTASCLVDIRIWND